MKRVACAVLGLWLGVVASSCGSNGGTGTTEPPRSGLTKRVLVTNEFAGTAIIVNGENDTFSRFAISVPNQPGRMIVSSDKAVTLVFSTGSSRITEITNVDEQTGAQVSVGDFSESFAISADKKIAYVAVRNTNEVVLVDLENNNVKQRVSVPLPRRLVLGPNGAKLLVFSDNTPADDTAFYVVDTATAATDPATSVTRISDPVLDHPTWAVFTSDSNRAFVLSCGPECGGTTASVTDVTMPAATIGTNVAVDAATIGILDGSTLYVAGTTGGAVLGGMLSELASGPLSFTREVPIGDGFHHEMELAANNKLYIAATNCSKTVGEPLSGCLSMYDRSAHTAVMTVGGDVTGVAAIGGRSVVYVIDDGELVIYDTASSAPQATQLDVIGRAVDVVQIDP